MFIELFCHYWTRVHYWTLRLFSVFLCDKYYCHEVLSSQTSPNLKNALVQFSWVAQLCPTLCNPMDCSTPGLPVYHHSWSLLKHMSVELVMPSNHLIFCCPLLPPSIFLSIRVFSNESVLCSRWPKYWSFSFNISPSNECSGLVGSPCSPRDSQESSPTPQFKSISSLALRFLYSPTLTSIHEHWKNHSLD